MKQYLFIGGSRDGDVISISDKSAKGAILVDAESDAAVRAVKEALDVRQFVRETYVPTLFVMDDKEVIFMIHESLTPQEVWPKLIAGYNPKGKR